MRGETRWSRRAAAGSIGALVVTLLVLMIGPRLATSERSDQSASDPCATAGRLAQAANVSDWGTDRGLPYADLQSFSRTPSAYQTVWMRHLEKLGAGTQTLLSDNTVDTYLLEVLTSDDFTAFGDRSSALYRAATVLEPTDRTRATVREVATTLRRDSGYSPTVGAGPTFQSTSRVSLALIHMGLPVPREVLLSLAQDISRSLARSTPMSDPVQIDAFGSALSALSQSGFEFPATDAHRISALDQSAELLTRDGVSLTEIPALHSVALAGHAFGLDRDYRPLDLDDEFETYPNGWYGIAGATAPDPQVTFFVHALSSSNDHLNLNWGAVDHGWSQISGASFEASAIWASISDSCGLEYPADVGSVYRVVAEHTHASDLSATEALMVAHFVSSLDLSLQPNDERSIAARLEALYVTAVQAGDAISAARAVSAARELGLERDDWPAYEGPVVGETNSLTVHAEAVLSMDADQSATAQPIDKISELRLDGLFASSQSAEHADIISTNYMLTLSDEDGPAVIDALDRFHVDGLYCQEVPDGSNDCQATLLALLAAVDLVESPGIALRW